ncbi:hypothetical protein BSNK01_16020 [Bacillaceae bacterium]
MRAFAVYEWLSDNLFVLLLVAGSLAVAAWLWAHYRSRVEQRGK